MSVFFGGFGHFLAGWPIGAASIVGLHNARDEAAQPAHAGCCCCREMKGHVVHLNDAACLMCVMLKCTVCTTGSADCCEF